jgi:uncharacterized protein (DUF305 family)
MDLGGSRCTTKPSLRTSNPSKPYYLRFIEEMIIADAERAVLRDLARRIQTGQQRQIDQVREWRAQWYPDAPSPEKDMEAMGR